MRVPCGPQGYWVFARLLPFPDGARYVDSRLFHGRRWSRALCAGTVRRQDCRFTFIWLTRGGGFVYSGSVNTLMSITKFDIAKWAADRDLYSGLIRLHVLHHAVEAPIFGLGMIEELARHGYRISPGSLYPLLHGLEKKGYLRSSERRMGRSLRRVYRATPLGRKAREAAKEKVHELLRELMEGD